MLLIITEMLCHICTSNKVHCYAFL